MPWPLQALAAVDVSDTTQLKDPPARFQNLAGIFLANVNGARSTLVQFPCNLTLCNPHVFAADQK